MKKVVTLLISLIMLIGTIPTTAGAYGDITVELNGEKIYFDQPPIIQNNRTLVPMRAIFEAMDCEVVWHGDLKQIVVWKNGEVFLNLEIDRDYIDIHYGDERVDLDVPPQIINGRTLVPLRAISETMGATVDWDGTLQKVTITYNNNNSDYSGYQSDNNTDTDTDTEVDSIYQNSRKADHFDPDYNVKMTEGDTQDLTWDCDIYVPAEDIDFYSDNENIAEIDDEGRITAISAGETKIHAIWGRFDWTGDLRVVEDTSSSKDSDSDSYNGNNSDGINNNSMSTFDYVKDLSILNEYTGKSSYSSISVIKNNGVKLSVDASKKRTGLEAGAISSCFVEYDVGQYKKLTAQISAANHSTALNIYGDGEIIYKTPKMNSSSTSIDLDIDISGYTTLRFEAYNTVNNGNSGGRILISEAKLWY